MICSMIEIINTLRKQSPSQKGIETHETGCIFMHFGHVKLKIVIFLTGNHGNGRELHYQSSKRK